MDLWDEEKSSVKTLNQISLLKVFFFVEKGRLLFPVACGYIH